MKRALFVVWLAWILSMLALFAPLLLAIFCVNAAIALFGVALAGAFHFLTGGVFK